MNKNYLSFGGTRVDSFIVTFDAIVWFGTLTFSPENTASELNKKFEKKIV
jgi:hypothetical protein